ncbi:glycosyltransferase [Pseudonocardia sp. CA-107938]|uniref:glycosyltransferase n=1 Tax=Pseudonocardia sp. CA-107938 TaxID=3240021 RepID=UPI003D8DD307
MTGVLRIAIIASARFPIREPFAGGLESHTWYLARALRRRGHELTVFAAPGSDPGLGVDLLPVDTVALSAAARADASMRPEWWMAEHHAYLRLMLDLAERPDRFDVVHNNSLHHLPVALAPLLSTPVVTTLHTPPTPWLESAIRARPDNGVVFVAVSAHTAAAWRPLVPDALVIRNGIDLDEWSPGPGGGPLVWTGRITPEKGTHLALDAARHADRPLLVAGPIADTGYWRSEVEPRLDGRIRYVGHLGRRELRDLVAAASAVLVTPCWDEPYGLVVAEALACGTPVAGFAIGALPELVDDTCGRLVPPGDVAALAAVIPETTALPRSAARRRAERDWAHPRMVDEYVRLYEQVAA